ncbi:MAG: hypothetical protein JWN52_1199 [Actinomycetia bacterium]|nr:hypothetical protein [Actinomycetes bacterium]
MGVGEVETVQGLDTSRPHPARVYDCWLGGKDNYAVDRAVAQQTVELAPETLRSVRDNRAFLHRAVRYLAEEVGIDQFIDIGSGLPTMENTHEVAQRYRSGARVVYVDNDPVVFAHGNALLATNGHTRVIQADLRDPDQILGHREICSLIDPGRPVAILLVAVLHFLGDADDPYAIVARLREAAAPGSHLVVSHLTGDCDPAKGREAVKIWERARAAVVPTLRTRRQVEGLLDGLDVVDPGVVPIDD